MQNPSVKKLYSNLNFVDGCYVYVLEIFQQAITWVWKVLWSWIFAVL